MGEIEKVGNLEISILKLFKKYQYPEILNRFAQNFSVQNGKV